MNNSENSIKVKFLLGNTDFSGTVIGIDPGYDRCGFAVLNLSDNMLKVLDYGYITSNATDDLTNRLQEIGKDFNDLLKQHAPRYVFIEQVYFSKNKTTSLKIAQVIGMLTFIAVNNASIVKNVHPMSVKKQIVGTGKATKKQVEYMINQLFKNQFNFVIDDVADAFAIAYTGINQLEHSGKKE